MNFRIAPDSIQKLSLLDDALRFEPAGDQPMAERSASPRAPKPLPCISEVTTPTGKKPILKAMMTTACERDCFYCPFRAGRSQTQRITYTPDEMARTYDTIHRAGLVDGLFLSSGIIKGGVSTQDKLIDTAEILRKRYHYRGYIHLKIMPGAEYDQVRRAMQLADRVSINLEGATAERLAALAPKKDYWNELFPRLQWMSELRRKEGLRASIVTQFVVGAVGDTDLELLQVSEHLYSRLGLRRTYFMAFHPVIQTPFESLPPVSPQREFRLYQASFLLRDYGWSVEDLPFLRDGNLPLDVDPKLAWAREHLLERPVDVNRAERCELLRIPGVGPKLADAILAARRRGRIREIGHLVALGLRDVEKASPFLLLDGKPVTQQLRLLDFPTAAGLPRTCG
jgi:predicted DNA-binding helix-hairpin-helix protein